MMFSPVAYRMLEAMGKPPQAQGVITPEQMDSAIDALNKLIAQHRAPLVDDEHSGEPHIGLAQRALPLLDLLEIARKAGKPVIWRDSATSA